MEGIVGLSAKERARLVELEQVKAGRQTVAAAAERLSMSERQGKRIKEMRLRGIKDLPAANALLRNGFLEAINERFAHSAASRIDHHRRVPKGLRLEDVFVFEDERTVQNDWTVVSDSRFFQITGPRALLPLRRQRIVVRRRLDGSRVLLHHGRALEFHEIPQRPHHSPKPIIPASLKASRPSWVPAENHPWKKSLTVAAQASRERRLRAAAP